MKSWLFAWILALLVDACLPFWTAVLFFLQLVSVANSQPSTSQPPPNKDWKPKQAGIDPKQGNVLEWEGWKIRWQFRDIEGLVLTDVHFKNRKVLKSINLAEIYVPYATGNPRPEDFSLGGFAGNPFPLIPGLDCIAQTGTCSAFLRDGSPAKGSNADVMIHEEPTGFLYAGQLGRAPGKMLVLWTMAHFPGPNDGYTYVLRWKLKTDGSLCTEVGATGGLQHLNTGKDPDQGLVVAKDGQEKPIFAPAHVHNYYFRIDFDIDGADNNSAQEFSYVLDEDDPAQARVVYTDFEIERGRFRREDIFRSWRVVNTKSRNALGHQRSYHLLPGGHGSWKDGLPNPVLKGDFFITTYKPDEFPYTTVDPRRMLNALTSYLDEEPVTETDIVAWYRLSFVHQPRTEDWPDQPIVWHSFDLIPRDFLDESPLESVRP
jgi:primary-amine oxidase